MHNFKFKAEAAQMVGDYCTSHANINLIIEIEQACFNNVSRRDDRLVALLPDISHVME